MTQRITPQAGGLVARMLEEEAAKQPPQSARVALATLPESVHMSAWYEQHVALLHQFLHRTLRAIASTPARRNRRLMQSLEQAHAELKRHAHMIAGDAAPRVLSRDGKHSIPYERLAESRAKVQVLSAELAQARDELSTLTIEGWRPKFDALCPQQEELAIQFCREIAGRRDETGRLPDPVRLLEMAQALYMAERDALHSETATTARHVEPAPSYAVHRLPSDDTEGGAP